MALDQRSSLSVKILALTLSYADRRRPSRFADRGSHELRTDWIANTFAKDCVDRGEVAFAQGPTEHFLDGGELIRATCAPECDTNTRLIEEPTDRQMDYAFPEALASECVQLARRIQVLG